MAAKTGVHFWLSRSRRPEQQDVLTIGDPAALGEITDLLGIDRRLCGKFEAGDVAMKREARKPHPHFDPALVSARDFARSNSSDTVSRALNSPRGLRPAGRS